MYGILPTGQLSDLQKKKKNNVTQKSSNVTNKVKASDKSSFIYILQASEYMRMFACTRTSVNEEFKIYQTYALYSAE